MMNPYFYIVTLQLEIKGHLKALKGLKSELNTQQHIMKNFITDTIDTSKRDINDNVILLLIKLKCDHQ